MANAVLMRTQVAALSTYRTHFISSPAVQRLRGTAITYYQPVLQRIFSPEKLLAGLPLQPRTVASKTKWESGLVTSRRSFCTRAMNQVNDPGSISSSLMQSMEKKIKEHVSAESVSVTDINGDGRHVSIDIISSNFEGKSAVNRQRMVYKAIWEELQNTVHAVDQMTTRTPSEAAGNR